VADLLILTWIGLIGEPVIRFWQASHGRSRVQRARLRGLSVAFAVLIAILLVATVAGNRLHSTGEQVATQLVALAMVPVLYGSLSRPGQLGRRWRALDNDELQDTIKDLLVFSPDRTSLPSLSLRARLAEPSRSE